MKKPYGWAIIFIYIINLCDCVILSFVILSFIMGRRAGKLDCACLLYLSQKPVTLSATTWFSRVKTCAHPILVWSTIPTHFPSFGFGASD